MGTCAENRCDFKQLKLLYTFQTINTNSELYAVIYILFSLLTISLIPVRKKKQAVGNSSYFGTEQAVGGSSYFGSEQAVGNSSYFGTEPAAGDSDSYYFYTEQAVSESSYFDTQQAAGDSSYFVLNKQPVTIPILELDIAEFLFWY
jgi:hypothetical protein